MADILTLSHLWIHETDIPTILCLDERPFTFVPNHLSALLYFFVFPFQFLLQIYLSRQKQTNNVVVVVSMCGLVWFGLVVFGLVGLCQPMMEKRSHCRLLVAGSRGRMQVWCLILRVIVGSMGVCTCPVCCTVRQRASSARSRWVIVRVGAHGSLLQEASHQPLTPTSTLTVNFISPDRRHGSRSPLCLSPLHI
jgi:hypothetical protein